MMITIYSCLVLCSEHFLSNKKIFVFSMLVMFLSALATSLCWSWKPELRCRLSKGHINLGKPQGVGISEWEKDGGQMGRDGDEKISLRATYDQGGRILSQQGGFQVSKGDQEREQKGISKGR
jgi:hypothetical protein